MHTLQRMRRFVQNGHVQSKRPRVHPLRRMPCTVQVRRIEIGGAAVESSAGFSPQTNAADMPSGKGILRSAALIGVVSKSGYFFDSPNL